MDEQHRLIQQRHEKLQRLEELGVTPFPYRFDRTHALAELLEVGEAMVDGEQKVRVAGRLMSFRRHGKTAFGHLVDERGTLQIYVRKDEIGEENYEAFKLLDIGDFVGVSGSMMRTRTGELTVQCDGFQLLSKSLRPLPEKWHGLTDKEQRYRQRYVDLIMNEEVRALFIKRAKIIDNIRRTLMSEDFLEVDTPVLQPLYGGATARPFKTLFHALGDATLYMRVADELYLKRLIVGGYDRVFEIGKDFRNEGMDRTHNPEFSMMECYAAYWDYEDVMRLVDRIFANLCEEFTDDGKIQYGEHVIDLGAGFRRVSFFELLHEETGTDFKKLTRDETAARAKAIGIEVEASMGKGRLLDDIFSEKVEPKLIQPTYVCDHPLELSPLAKKHRDDPELVERFEPFIAGFEVGN
ncbi:MAG TPA: lysine--tRNA ligase, partial [Candidatus Krumholzibacteria bacterium]